MKFKVDDTVYYTDLDGIEHLATIKHTQSWSKYYIIILESGEQLHFIEEKYLRPDWRIRDEKLKQLGI